MGPSKAGFPYVSFTSWLQYLVESDELDHLVGVKTLAEMEALLAMFWDRFLQVHPWHVMAGKSYVCRRRCIPVLIHGDEGRGLKKKQLMVLNVHGVLGKGSRLTTVPENDRKKGSSQPLQLNMLGNTWLTHFLHSVLPISLYNDTPESFYHVLDLMAKEMTGLFNDGIEIRERRYYVCCIGIKGDAPFLAKAGMFERSFSHRPTRPTSKKAAVGICHLCLAGKEDHDFPVPYEQFGAEVPSWLQTVGCCKPYSRPSPLLQIGFDVAGPSVNFFHYDLFHNWHSGMGKYFASSAVIVCLELVDATIDQSFDMITRDFKDYCSRKKESPYHKKLSKALFGVEGGFQDCPDGGWSKGDFTRLILKWFADFCSRFVVGKTNDELYLKCVASFTLVLFNRETSMFQTLYLQRYIALDVLKRRTIPPQIPYSGWSYVCYQQSAWWPLPWRPFHEGWACWGNFQTRPTFFEIVCWAGSDLPYSAEKKISFGSKRPLPSPPIPSAFAAVSKSRLHMVLQFFKLRSSTGRRLHWKAISAGATRQLSFHITTCDTASYASSSRCVRCWSRWFLIGLISKISKHFGDTVDINPLNL